ncbi:unnamed protein product [Lasius platythorax]
MASLRLLLYGGLISIIATAFPVGENTKKSSIALDYYLDDVVPTHYDIKLITYFKRDEGKNDTYTKFKKDEQSRYFYGEFNATIDIIHPTTKISLNSSSTIYRYSGELIENNANNIRHFVEKFDYNNKTQICDLYFKVEVPRGNYILNIKFFNAINVAEDDVIFFKTKYITKLESKV